MHRNTYLLLGLFSILLFQLRFSLNWVLFCSNIVCTYLYTVSLSPCSLSPPHDSCRVVSNACMSRMQLLQLPFLSIHSPESSKSLSRGLRHPPEESDLCSIALHWGGVITWNQVEELCMSRALLVQDSSAQFQMIPSIIHSFLAFTYCLSVKAVHNLKYERIQMVQNILKATSGADDTSFGAWESHLLPFVQAQRS